LEHLDGQPAKRGTARQVHYPNRMENAMNTLITATPVFTDSELYTHLMDAFTADPAVPETLIAVEIHDGLVTLIGNVDWHYQSEAAETIAHKLPGIRGVTNRLTVNPKVNSHESW
jgi:osmotically-inducible protein OsmY